MFAKESLLLLACLAMDTFAYPYQEPFYFDEMDVCDNFSPCMGFGESEYDGFFDGYLPADTNEFEVLEDFVHTFNEHDEHGQFFGSECYNEFETYCKDLQSIMDLEAQMDYFTTIELIDIVYSIMPNIPESLINVIVQTDGSFIDYIFRVQDKSGGPAKKVEACTVKHFCKDVPSFGEKLGELSDEVLNDLISKHPGLDKCVVSPTGTANRTAIHAISELATDEIVTEEEQ
ncbi:unnamed protein product [Hymenolepis diminuta]|uniref:Uncharacterized protein n=1 Tax=Hymenolepis diminuta TaxID=6216 RepID=A0A0R3SG02_HYMDI|nr:unnamed protein product [Hymenolepis diminuta]VUZ52022.1 unnamed protein product [Hymenolepis diminuta]